MPRVNRRQFLQSAAAAAAAAPFVACRGARRPNVVFVLSDDLRWDCMGVAGHPFLKTPNIDRIANEGIRFSNAFCTEFAVLAEPRQLSERPLRAQPSGHQQLHRVSCRHPQLSPAPPR